MQLRHYTVTITPDGRRAHHMSMEAISGLAALVQIVEDALSHGLHGPVFVLGDDGKPHELLGFKFAKEDS